MPHVIAIANEKGGVAKTTTVVSLAGALIQAGYEVLVIDLDTQANLTLALGLNPSTVRRSVSDVLLNSASLLSVSRETPIPGLDLVPSNADMGLAERFLPVRQNYETILSHTLHDNPALSAYQFVLLDCPPSLGAVTTNALMAASHVVAPTQPEYFSAYGLRSLMAAIRRVRGQGNPALAYFILVTMMDRRNRIHRTLLEQLQATFREGLLDTIIEVDTKLRESTVAGLPITHYSPKSRSAIQYAALAQELVAHVQEKASQPD
ncbi:MAG TPA: ParA family protein [Anaerolineales bacterium]|nr:ParA family protein [Anaerolineales bacterium]